MRLPICLSALLMLATFVLGQDTQYPLTQSLLSEAPKTGERWPPETPEERSERKRRYASQASVFKEWRARNPPEPQPMSLRTPGYCKRNNRADMIEEQMLCCNESTWGFIIYRTTYGNNVDWLEFISGLNATIEDDFEAYNGSDVFDQMNMTVMSDQELFDGASTHDIREHFQAWIAQHEPPRTPHRMCSSEPGTYPSVRTPSRYVYIVSVDAESLQSVIHDEALAPQGHRYKSRGWVNLIQSSYQLWMGPAAEWEKPYEPVEGITEYNVGYMRVLLDDITEFYERSDGTSIFDTGYQRPPWISGVYDDFPQIRCPLPPGWTAVSTLGARSSTEEEQTHSSS